MARGRRGGRGSGGRKRGGHYHGPVRSKAQQRYIFGVLAKRDPRARVWGKRWSRMAGEVGPHGKPSAASKAAYRRLPRRRGVRKHV